MNPHRSSTLPFGYSTAWAFTSLGTYAKGTLSHEMMNASSGEVTWSM
jgi:hypothetical protein